MRKTIFLCFIAFFPLSTLVADRTIEQVNADISNVRKKIHTDRMKEMDEEIHGQRFMLDEWKEYSDNLEKVEKIQDEEADLQKQLNDLLDERARLLKSK